jgi:hypothetical protein
MKFSRNERQFHCDSLSDSKGASHLALRLRVTPSMRSLRKHLILAQQNHPKALLNFSNLADHCRAGFWRAGGPRKTSLKPRAGRSNCCPRTLARGRSQFLNQREANPQPFLPRNACFRASGCSMRKDENYTLPKRQFFIARSPALLCRLRILEPLWRRRG